MVQRAAKHWVRFSYKGAELRREGAALGRAWKALHRGDREPFPDAKHVAAVLAAAPGAAVASLDAAGLATALTEAWRAFHAGDFERAWHEGGRLGALGAGVAAKAATVHASYLEDDDARARALLADAAARVAAAARLAPSVANLHYFEAYALGRLSLRMSVLKALAAGHAPRIRAALEATLALEPAHADAEIAFGLWHAEIVGKVGALAARLTYAASRESALGHFRKALKLDPLAPIAHIEYANGLLAMDGDDAQDAAVELYEKAVALAPRDAMEWLDVEQARAELE
jgi:tetratricopeptide (TPR) repeat protein